MLADATEEQFEEGARDETREADETRAREDERMPDAADEAEEEAPAAPPPAADVSALPDDVEMKRARQHLGRPPTAKEAEAMVADADANGDGDEIAAWELGSTAARSLCCAHMQQTDASHPRSMHMQHTQGCIRWIAAAVLRSCALGSSSRHGHAVMGTQW